MDQMDKRENALENSKKHIYSKINSLRLQLLNRNNKIQYLTREIEDWRNRAWDRRADMLKMQKLSKALKTVQEFLDNGTER